MYFLKFHIITKIVKIVKIIEPEAGPPFTSYNSSSHNAYV